MLESYSACITLVTVGIRFGAFSEKHEATRSLSWAALVGVRGYLMSTKGFFPYFTEPHIKLFLVFLIADIARNLITTDLR